MASEHSQNRGLCEHGCQPGEACRVTPCPALAHLRERPEPAVTALDRLCDRMSNIADCIEHDDADIAATIRDALDLRTEHWSDR